MKRAPAIALAASLALPLAPTPAAAQDGWSWSVIIPSVTGTDVLGQTLRQQTAPDRAATPGPAPSRTAADPAALRFTPTAEARKANFARLLAERRPGVDATTFRQLETLLANPQLMPTLERELAKRGLRADDMADAFAIWWIQSWQIVHGQTQDPSPAAIRAVQAQARRAMLTLPSLLSAPDASKQAFAEGLLVQAGILGTVQEQLVSDPAGSQRLAEGVRQGAKAQAGLDLGAMRLTEAGFSAGG